MIGWGALALAGLATAGGTAWLWHSGWFGRQIQALVDGAYALTADAGLAVGEVLVEGRERTGRELILETLAVGQGYPILAIDLRDSRARLEALPWVRSAEVERHLPGLIYVRLEERRPLALWQLDGRFSVIDDSGQVIPGASAESFADLPLVVGPDAPQRAAELLAMLRAEPALNELVVAAVRVGGRRWNIRLAGGIDVRLPEAEPAAAWAQLARIEREQGVIKNNVVMIDLRLKDRLVVRTTSGAKGGGPVPGGEET